MKQEKSKWIFSDKHLKSHITWQNVLDSNKKNIYCYDGNNGDKHLIVGYTLHPKQILAVNLIQRNPSKLIEQSTKVTPSVLYAIFNKIVSLNF